MAGNPASRPRQLRTVSMSRLLAPVVLGLVGMGGRGHAQSACRPADSASTYLIRDLTRVATGTDPANARMREIAHIPRVAPSQIVYVASEAVCRQALPVYNAETTVTSISTGQALSRPSTHVYVVRVAPVYAALDPKEGFGEYALLVVMDQHYRGLASTGL